MVLVAATFVAGLLLGILAAGFYQAASGPDITVATSTPATITTTVTVSQASSAEMKPVEVEHGYVEFDGVTILVEISDEPDERARGLSGRSSLRPGWGMIFVFEASGIYSFWMYGMLFPLDIIWLDEEGRVVYIVADAQPCLTQGDCLSYTPESEAVYIIEAESGFTRRHNITVGSQARIYLEV